MTNNATALTTSVVAKRRSFGASPKIATIHPVTAIEVLGNE